MKYCIVNGRCVNGLKFPLDQKDMMDLKLERNLCFKRSTSAKA